MRARVALLALVLLVRIAPAHAAPSPGWVLTTYYAPVETYFAGEMATALGCDGTSLGDHPVDFLNRVRLNGTGRLAAGGYIAFDPGGSCWRLRTQILGANGKPVQAFVSVAADRIYPFGTPARVVECGSGIPSATVCEKVRSSSWVVADRGGGVTGMQLDLYVGEQDRPDFEHTSPFVFRATGAVVDIAGAAVPGAPVFAGAACGGPVSFPLSLTAPVPTSVTLSAAGEAGRTVTMSASALPAWVSFQSTPGNPARGTLTGTPGVFDWIVGLVLPAVPMTVRATDDASPPRVSDCVLRPSVTLQLPQF